MSYPNSLRVRELWLKMKAYINNRIETLEQGITMKVLWENPNPTAEFAAQTINVNLSGYTHYEVLFALNSASYKDLQLSTGIVPIDKRAFLCYGWGDVNTVGTRNVSAITSNSIAFTVGYYNKATNNSYVIPIAIYGIKGVQ